MKVKCRAEKYKTSSPVSEMVASPKTTTMNRFMMRKKRRATMQDVYADTNLVRNLSYFILEGINKNLTLNNPHIQVQISRSKTLIKQGHLYTDHGNNKSSSWMQKYFILTRRHLIFKDDAEDDVTLKTRSFPILDCEPFKVRWKGQIRIPLSRTISKMMYVVFECLFAHLLTQRTHSCHTYTTRKHRYAASIHWTKSKSFTKVKAKLRFASEDEETLKAWVVKLAHIGNCSKLQHRPSTKHNPHGSSSVIRRGIERLFFGGGTSKKATFEAKNGARTSLDLRKRKTTNKKIPLSKRKHSKDVLSAVKSYDDGGAYNP